MKVQIFLIIVALVAVSCGKLGDKNESDKSDNALSSKNADKAGNIIAYNNALVAFMNAADSQIDRASSEYERMYLMVTNKKKPVAYVGVAFVGSDPSLKHRSSGITITEPGDYLPADARNKLKETINNANDAYNSAKEAYKALNIYVKNEDFMDDDWQKGQSLTETIKNNISKFYENQEVSYQILKPFADEAEIKLLENHPLKEVIMASKTDLNLAQDILSLVHAEQLDIEKLTEKYNLLQSNYNNHNNLTPDLLKKHKKQKQYNNFYKEIEAFLGEVRKSKRDGEITNSEARSIASDYDTLIVYYNQFV